MGRKKSVFKLALCISLPTGMLTAEIIDRVAIVVDGAVIKQSDILNEIRVTDFLNGAKPDLSLVAQERAASRLIDQKLIRKAMEAGLYLPPSSAETSQLLQQVRQRFATDTAYTRELAARSLTEDLLKEHLLWQLAVLRFVSLRFQGSDADAVNQQFFAWLDESRKTARIDFKVKRLQGESK
jgi:hypothetical protein